MYDIDDEVYYLFNNKYIKGLIMNIQNKPIPLTTAIAGDFYIYHIMDLEKGDLFWCSYDRILPKEKVKAYERKLKLENLLKL